VVKIGEGNSVGDRDTTLVLRKEDSLSHARVLQNEIFINFLPHENLRRLFVESNSKPFQLGFNDFLVTEWLQDVKHDKDKVTCTSDYNRRTLA
jgi:hypothetical protein